MMHTLKDIAARLGDCHVRTAERWIKKLQVPPTKPAKGGSPNLWDGEAVQTLYARWILWFKTQGTTPQIHRAKFAGTFSDSQQLPLDFNATNPVKKIPVKAQSKVSFKSARQH